MTICFVGPDNLPVLAPEYGHLPIGGESVQQTLLACALARRGYSVSMVVADHGQVDGQVWRGVRVHKSYPPDAGIPVIRFAHPRWTGLWSALKRADAEIYYTSCAGMHVGLIAMFCRRYGRRLIFRAASDPDCDRARLPLLVKYARDRWLYRYGLRRADAILVQSTVQEEALAASYRMPSRVAGMLVDGAAASCTRDIDLLWVGNIKRVKRPDRALDLAGRFPSARVHIVGGETPGEHAYFRGFRQRAFSSPNVVYHGRLAYQEAAALYARARLLVNTSDVEGFPNAYLQAWQNGVPVATLIDPDAVIAREGLGAVASSAERLPDAVQGLLNDASAWHAASMRCRSYMARNYGEERVLADYVDTIHCVMRSSAGGRRVFFPSGHHG
jgi:glycosyltransferase involved in cell wall biosynthesis